MYFAAEESEAHQEVVELLRRVNAAMRDEPRPQCAEVLTWASREIDRIAAGEVGLMMRPWASLRDALIAKLAVSGCID